MLSLSPSSHRNPNIAKMSPHEMTVWLGCGKNRSLYRYQADSVRTMILNASKPSGQRHGMILADEMGLGKTFQSLCVIAGLEKLNPNQPPALLVVPKTVLDSGQWTEEALRFKGWAQKEIFIYHGNNRQKDFDNRVISLRENNKKMMEINRQTTLIEIQNMMRISSTFERSKKLFCRKTLTTRICFPNWNRYFKNLVTLTLYSKEF